MLWTMLLLGAISQVDVEISLSDGSIQSGRLDVLAAERVVIAQPEGSREFVWNELRQIRFSGNSAGLSGTAEQLAELTDGTQLAITDFKAAGDRILLKNTRGSSMWEIPRRHLRAVRLMPLEGEHEHAWHDVVQRGSKADVLVKRRPDGRLQPIEGVIAEVNEATVKFLFDRELFNVRRETVAGVVYAVPNLDKPGMPIGQLVLNDSGRLPLRQIELQDHRLLVTTPNGSEFTIPLEQVRYVDFAATSTVYLSDMESESTTLRPFLLIPALSDVNRRWYEPQRDRRLSREPLIATIDGTPRSFTKGLGLHSRTELVYRLAGEFRRFLAWAAVDEHDGAGDLELIILADGREIYRQAYRSGENPQAIDVDMSGVNRMQVVVDYGGHGDAGDQISLYDARLIK